MKHRGELTPVYTGLATEARSQVQPSYSKAHLAQMEACVLWGPMREDFSGGQLSGLGRERKEKKLRSK